MGPPIYSVGLKQRSLQLRYTSRRGYSKILRLKSDHCMLNARKSKIDNETPPNCETHVQIVRCKQKKHQNITFYTVTNVIKRGRCYVKQ